MKGDQFKKTFPFLLSILVIGVFLSPPVLHGKGNPSNPPQKLNHIGKPQIRMVEASDETSNILVELFLSREQKDNLDAIKKEFGLYSIQRVRAQFYRLGKSPKNIAIGREVPAPIARLALGLAQTYNGGIDFLMPQVHFFPEYITIGSSAFDEASNIPVSREELDRLSDPSLSTEQFHSLYRFITGEGPEMEFK